MTEKAPPPTFGGLRRRRDPPEGVGGTLPPLGVSAAAPNPWKGGGVPPAKYKVQYKVKYKVKPDFTRVDSQKSNTIAKPDFTYGGLQNLTAGTKTLRRALKPYGGH